MLWLYYIDSFNLLVIDMAYSSAMEHLVLGSLTSPTEVKPHRHRINKQSGHRLALMDGGHCQHV